LTRRDEAGIRAIGCAAIKGEPNDNDNDNGNGNGNGTRIRVWAIRITRRNAEHCLSEPN
jgi:hypothetical protein